MPFKLPSDFAQKISEVLDFKESVIPEWFDVGEDKDGWFFARLQPKKWLSDLQFKAMCALVRDFNGEYVKGQKLFKVPGLCAKKPQTQNTTSTPSPMEPRSKTEPTVAPHVLTMDKSKVPFPLIPLEALLSMPFQSRQTLEDPDLPELVESVKTYGILEPILVRAKPNGLYEIVAGERRVAAAKKAGLKEISAHVKVLSDQEAYEVQLIENIQRKDLSDMEKARMLDYMIKKFNYTQEQLAQKLGKNQSWISRHLSMLQVDNIMPRGIMEKEDITERQARELLAAPEEKREEILEGAKERGEFPSSREIRRAAQPESKSSEEELEEQEESTEAPSPTEEPATPKPEAIDIGEFECPECHQQFLVEHVNRNLHRLRPVKTL